LPAGASRRAEVLGNIDAAAFASSFRSIITLFALLLFLPLLLTILAFLFLLLR